MVVLVKKLPYKDIYIQIRDVHCCLCLLGCYAGFLPTRCPSSLILVRFLFSSVASHVRLFATPWNVAHQASLSIKLPESIQSHVHWVGDAIQPSYPLLSPSPPALNLFPALGSFPVSQLFASGDQSIGVSASTSVLPMNTQDWPPLGWTGWISLQSKGLSRVFSNTTVQKHPFFGTQLSL